MDRASMEVEAVRASGSPVMPGSNGGQMKPQADRRDAKVVDPATPDDDASAFIASDTSRTRSDGLEADGGQAFASELCVLAGRQVGARIAFEPGASLLGSARHCEIVLRDEGVDPEHLLFSVGAERVTMRVLGSAVRVDGRRLADGQVALQAGTVIHVGRARIGVAPVGFDWQAVHDGAVGARAGGAAAQPGDKMAQWRARLARQPRATLAAGAVVLGLLAVLAAAMAGGFGKAVPTQAERVERASERLETLGLAEVRAEPQGDGRISIVGYVPDLSALRRLRQAMVDEDIVIKAYPASELTRFASEWLGSRKLKARVNYLGNGALEVVGQDSEGGRLSAAAEQLALEVPGVSSVRQRIAQPVVVEAPRPVPAEPEPYVLGGVNGVNAGHSMPYISSGQSYIFTGGALKNGMTVMAIEPERVVVDDHGRRLASEIQVR